LQAALDPGDKGVLQDQVNVLDKLADDTVQRRQDIARDFENKHYKFPGKKKKYYK
jgi:hypothetical protein